MLKNFDYLEFLSVVIEVTRLASKFVYMKYLYIILQHTPIIQVTINYFHNFNLISIITFPTRFGLLLTFIFIFHIIFIIVTV